MEELIVYDNGQGIEITDTEGMMELMMHSWDGVGLPDEKWVKNHFKPQIFNGSLIFDPGIGMFRFYYTNSLIKKTYRHIIRCMKEIEEGFMADSQFEYQLTLHVAAGRITVEEAEALRRACW